MVIAHPDLDNDTKSATLRALNKLIWIRNDCRFPFLALNGIATNKVVVSTRYYVADLDTPNSVVAPNKGLLEGAVGEIVTSVVIAVRVLRIQTIVRRWYHSRVLRWLVVMSVHCCVFSLVGCSVFPTSSTVVRPFTALVLFLESLLLGLGRVSGGSAGGSGLSGEDI